MQDNVLQILLKGLVDVISIDPPLKNKCILDSYFEQKLRRYSENLKFSTVGSLLTCERSNKW